MHRTIPWDKRDHSKKTKAKSMKGVYDHELQPLSTIFHDTTFEITGRFSKSYITTKKKEKTRGDADPTEITNELARTPSPTRRVEFEIDADSIKAWRAMFHMPGDNFESSKLRWNDVTTAMVELGFSAQQMHGSQWQFDPLAAPVCELNLARGVSFHAPHSSDEVPPVIARRYGRRLNRAYGWDGSMFIIE